VYQRKDAFYVRARAVGYRSRAAFKLEELAQRSHLFRRGDRVVDLGAWPGGWLQVAARSVGPTGSVIGIDLQPIDPLPEKNVITLTGDVTDAEVVRRVEDTCGGRADVVLSDLAPKLSGVRARDDVRARALAESTLDLAERILKPGGTLVVKLFMSDELSCFVARLRTCFAGVRTTRPEATRKGSAEIYAVATGFHGAP
jgi:23S rRNA (uridine2552-2'-O)-methyltransferase